MQNPKPLKTGPRAPNKPFLRGLIWADNAPRCRFFGGRRGVFRRKQFLDPSIGVKRAALSTNTIPGEGIAPIPPIVGPLYGQKL